MVVEALVIPAFLDVSPEDSGLNAFSWNLVPTYLAYLGLAGTVPRKLSLLWSLHYLLFFHVGRLHTVTVPQDQSGVTHCRCLFLVALVLTQGFKVKDLK